jgi:hypothetical protein
MNEWDFNDRIYKPYYKEHVGSSTKTSKTMYDETGMETSNPSLAKTVKYIVKVNKRKNDASFAGL